MVSKVRNGELAFMLVHRFFHKQANKFNFKILLGIFFIDMNDVDFTRVGIDY